MVRHRCAGGKRQHEALGREAADGVAARAQDAGETAAQLCRERALRDGRRGACEIGQLLRGLANELRWRLVRRPRRRQADDGAGEQRRRLAAGGRDAEADAVGHAAAAGAGGASWEGGTLVAC